MPDRIPCEFFLIRYVPDAVKAEFTNIGVVLREAGPGAASAQVRFTRDWTRVRCMDAGADIALLEALEAEMAARLSLGAADPKPLLEVIADTFSNAIQMTEARACLAESLPGELDLLMQLYVEPLRTKQERRRTGRAAIASAMRTQFERAGVWALMRKRISAATYTMPGDPMKLDCGYRAGDSAGGDPVQGIPPGVVKIFHAVSLEGDVEAAKGLAYSAGRLRAGVERVENAPLVLTAVVEPLRTFAGDGGAEDEGAERYRFGVDTLESEQIRVLTVSDLARAAQAARVDLRL